MRAQSEGAGPLAGGDWTGRADEPMGAFGGSLVVSEWSGDWQRSRAKEGRKYRAKGRGGTIQSQRQNLELRETFSSEIRESGPAGVPVVLVCSPFAGCSFFELSFRFSCVPPLSWRGILFPTLSFQLFEIYISSRNHPFL